MNVATAQALYITNQVAKLSSKEGTDSRRFLIGNGLCTSSSSPHLRRPAVALSGTGVRLRSKSLTHDPEPVAVDADAVSDTDSPSQ